MFSEQAMSVDDLVLLHGIMRTMMVEAEGREGLMATLKYGQHRAQLAQFIQYDQEMDQKIDQYSSAERNGSRAEMDKYRGELMQVEQAIQALFNKLASHDQPFMRFLVHSNIWLLCNTFEKEIIDLQSRHVVLPKQLAAWMQTLEDKRRSINYDQTQAQYNKIVEQIKTIVPDIIGCIQERDPDFNVYREYILEAHQLVARQKALLAQQAQWKVQDRQAYAAYLQSKITEVQDFIEQVEKSLKNYYTSDSIQFNLVLCQATFEIFVDEVNNRTLRAVV